MITRIKDNIRAHQAALAALERDPTIVKALATMASLCIESLKSGGKILMCGNGGSAADAQHLAAELSGRYLLDRPPLHVEALHVNTSYLTAVGNDYGFAEVYRRAVEAKGQDGDVLLALSTSGSSLNVILAARKAKEIGMTVMGMTGPEGSALAEACHHCVCIPSTQTPRIQEMHMLLGHTLCELIEDQIFNAKDQV